MRFAQASLFAFASLVSSIAAHAAELSTVLVDKIDQPREYRLDGVVEAIDRGTLSAQTSGQIQRILVDVDDLVEQGSLIIQLKATEQQAGLERAQANLQAATAQWQEAEREFTRTEGVYAKKLVSKSAMDKATANRKTMSAQKRAAEAAMQQAREQFEYTQVRAPYTGIVTERHVELGEMAQPGTPLISGVSLDNLRITVDVPQSLIAAVREQGKARVRTPAGAWVAVSKLTVFPFAERGSNSFKVRLYLPEKVPNLFPGMFVKTAFVTGGEKLLVVPAAAVVRRSEVTAAYVVGEAGGIQMRHIRVGRMLEDGRIAVLAGLSQGEMVATDPVAAGVALKQKAAE